MAQAYIRLYARDNYMPEPESKQLVRAPEGRGYRNDEMPHQARHDI